jgi:hypothetical protein
MPHLLLAVLLLTLDARADSAWEKQVGDDFENRGVAQIEKIGTKYALSILCDGTHSTYLDKTQMKIKLYLNKFLRVKYRYVERMKKVTCIQAPCTPVQERLIALRTVTVLPLTQDEAEQVSKTCP